MVDARSTLRVGIVGAGWMGQTHGQAWAENAPRGRLVAVTDISTARARALSDRFSGGTARIYQELPAMLADPQVDAVDICLPHHLHKDTILAAARAGKHVLCEKPLCLTLDEARAIRHGLEQAGVVFMCAHNKLFTPGMVEARRLLADGALGTLYVVRTVEAGYNEEMKNGTLPLDLAPGESPWSWRHDPAKSGGGEVLDNGWHAAYCLLALTGSRPTEVSAMLGHYFIKHLGVEDTGALLVRFEHGAVGVLLTSWAFADLAPGYEFLVAGERGSLAGTATSTVLGLHGTPPVKRSFDRVTVSARIAGILQAGARRARPTKGPQPFQHPLASSFTREIGHFLDAVQRGQDGLASWEDAARTLQLILGAYRAAAEGRCVALPEDPTEL